MWSTTNYSTNNTTLMNTTLSWVDYRYTISNTYFVTHNLFVNLKYGSSEIKLLHTTHTTNESTVEEHNLDVSVEPQKSHDSLIH